MSAPKTPSRALQDDLRRQALSTGLNRAARRALRRQQGEHDQHGQQGRQFTQAQPPLAASLTRPRQTGAFSADCGDLRRGELAQRPPGGWKA